MSRSIFDPTGGETERSGSTHLGPDAANTSHLPRDVGNGEVENDDDAEEGSLEAIDRAAETPGPFAADSTEAARRLGEMLGGGDEMQAPPDDSTVE
jgi:hypothetical protein